MTELEAYYNKFNEDKRLASRHGQVEFITSMKYIHKYLDEIKASRGVNLNNDSEGNRLNSSIKILDIGAATGGYSIPLALEGYDVTSVELVKHNLGILKKKRDEINSQSVNNDIANENRPICNITAYQGNALKLSKLKDETFDITLLFGPMYHLHSMDDKAKALSEAVRVTKKNGIILVAYIMNEYSVITYAFKEKNIKHAIETGMIDEGFHCTEKGNPLYSYVRLEDISLVNDKSLYAIKRRQIISADGAANYMRQFLNALSEEEFEYFIKYHLATCERMELMGAAGHTVDILERM